MAKRTAKKASQGDWHPADILAAFRHSFLGSERPGFVDLDLGRPGPGRRADRSGHLLPPPDAPG